MKKTAWAACLLGALGVPAMAGVVDGGEIRFSGQVRDQAPRWSWHLPTADQQWDVDIDDARVDARGMQVFALDKQGALPFLEGHLKEVATHGGSGMIPLVALSSAGQPLTAENGGAPGAQRYETGIPVFDADTGEAVGRLGFTHEQALAVASARALPALLAEGLETRAMLLVSGDTVRDVRPGQLSGELGNRLMTLLGQTAGMDGTHLPLRLGTRVAPQSVLSGSHTGQFAAAYASRLSGFSLSWPADKVPARWRASLNVVVTVR